MNKYDFSVWFSVTNATIYNANGMHFGTVAFSVLAIIFVVLAFKNRK